MIAHARDEASCPYVVGDDCLARWAGSEADAWLGLQRTHRLVTRKLEAALADRYGLSLSALELLGRLAAADGRAMRLSTLAGAVELSLSRVSRIVDALERRRLVERQACDDDARATNACLTDTGLELTREAQATHVADVQRHFFDRLSDADVDALADVFGRLQRA